MNVRANKVPEGAVSSRVADVAGAGEDEAEPEVEERGPRGRSERSGPMGARRSRVARWPRGS